MKNYFFILLLCLPLLSCVTQSVPENSVLPVKLCLTGGEIVKDDQIEKKLQVAPKGQLQIVNLGKKINSPEDDYAPCISLDGKSLYFSSNRKGSKLFHDGTNSHDFWEARLIEINNKDVPVLNLDKSTKFGDEGLNTSGHEGAQCISSDKKKLYFTSCNKVNGFGSCDIYVCELLLDGHWSKPQNLGPNINSKNFETGPSISPDGKRLYFCSTKRVPPNLNYIDSLNKVILYRFEQSVIEIKDKLSKKDKLLLQKLLNSTEITDFRNDKILIQIQNKLSIQANNLLDSLLIRDNQYKSSLKLIEYYEGLQWEDINIWYSDFDSTTKSWMKSKPLYGLNTDKKDQFPFICPDGKTLFFSSNGYSDTKGGLDFYVSKMNDDGSWKKPVNLGYPINTEKDENFITMPATCDVVYFSSSRIDLPNYQGALDLYMAYVPLVCSITSDEEITKNNNIDTNKSLKNKTTSKLFIDTLKIYDLKDSVKSQINLLNTNNEANKIDSINKEEIEIKFVTESNILKATIFIPHDTDVAMKIIDMTGKEVSTILNQNMKKGKYILPLAYNDLENGAYFFYLQAEDKVITQGFVISR